MDETPTNQESPATRVPVVKNGWMLVFLAFFVVASTGVILSLVYRQLPKRTEVIKKRKIPANHAVYATIIGPLPKELADSATKLVAAVALPDTSNTKMVLNGSYAYKQCTSFAEFKLLTRFALARATAPTIAAQALLLNKAVDVMLVDTVTSDMFILGSFRKGDEDVMLIRLNQFLSGIELRSKGMAKVRITTMVRPQGDPATELFLSELRRRNLDVTVL